MPLYEYECHGCGQRKEKLQKYDDPAPVCKTCKYEMEKKVSVTSFALAGSGWAKDNYGLKTSKK